MEELSFRIDWIAIVILASLILSKFLLIPRLEKYIEDEHSEEAVFKFKFWSTLLSWIPMFWLWFYVFGQIITFSWGLIIWCFLGIAGAGLLGFFNSINPRLTKGFVPHHDLLYTISTQLCIFIIVYVCLRCFGVIPYVFGPVFLIFLTVMLVFLITPSKVTSVSSEADTSKTSETSSISKPTISPASVEKSVYSFAGTMGTSSPIRIKSSYSYLPGDYSYSSDSDDFGGCLLIIGIAAAIFIIACVFKFLSSIHPALPWIILITLFSIIFYRLIIAIALLIIFLVTLILSAPVTLLQIPIILLGIFLLLPPLKYILVFFGESLKKITGLIFILLLPNFIADETLLTITTWVGLPALIGLPIIMLYGKLFIKAPTKTILTIVSISWAYLMLLTALLFLLKIQSFLIILSTTVIFIVILTLFSLQQELKIKHLIIPTIIIALIGIESVPRLGSKRFLRDAEDSMIKGNYTEAREYLQESMKLIKKYENITIGFFKVVPRLQLEKTHLELAKVAVSRGSWSEVFDYLKEIETRYGVYASKSTKIQTALLEAALYHEVEDGTKEEEMVKKAWEIANKTFNRPYWTAHVNRYKARLEMEKGNYNEAIKILKDVKKVGKRIGSYKLISSALSGLGDAYLKQGKYTDAEKFYNEALELSKKYKAKGDEAQYLLKLAMAQMGLDKMDIASNNLSQAITFAKQISSHGILWQGFYQRGLILERQGKRNGALKSYVDALDVIEQIRGSLPKEEYRLGYAVGKMPVYERIVSLLHKTGKKYEAFSYIQKGKSRALLDLLGSRMVAYCNEDKKLAEKEHLFHVKVKALMEKVSEEEAKPKRLQSGKLKNCKDELKKALKEHSEILAEIKRTNPKLASLITVPTVKISDVQNLLYPNEVFLEYFVTNEKILLYGLTTSNIKIFEIPINKTELDEIVLQIYESISTNSPPSISVLNIAYKSILEPALRYFSNKSHLIIAPCDKLYYIPFETLVIDRRAHTFVLDKYFVSYYPSASILVLNRKYKEKKPTPQRPIFAVGDPVFTTHDPRYPSKDKKLVQLAMADNKRGAFYRRVMIDNTIKPVIKEAQVIIDRLPETNREVKEISSILGVQEGSNDIKVGLCATEKEVKTADHTKYRYEHYATHGVLRGDIPGLKEPALIFSLPNPEDPGIDEGFWTMSEIFGMRTNADLVVLSACKTALGEDVPGEGLIGLTRAFMYAKVPSVVASLWSVADKSTADLMINYYRYLRQKKDKAEALTLAKRDLKKEGYYNPYYWAPFILIGER